MTLKIRGRKIIRGIFFIIALLALGGLVLSYFPDNYVFRMLSSIYIHLSEGSILANGSLVDRLYGFVGPLNNFLTTHGLIGYGFGGDATYFNKLFNSQVAAIIRDTKGALPQISSLQGKMIMYGGAIGYALYLSGWIYAYMLSADKKVFRAVIITLFGASIFSLAPLFLPYVWAWVALANTESKPAIAPFGNRLWIA